MEADPAGQPAQQTVFKTSGSKLGLSVTFFVLSLVILVIALIFLLFPGQVVKFLPFTSYYIKTVSIPLDITSPQIYRASFVYAFRTKVEGIENRNGQTILKTDLKGVKSLPEFIIDDNTKIAVVQNNIDIQTFTKDTNNLRKGDLVYVYLTYNIFEKRWSTTRVAIVMPDKALSQPVKAATSSGKSR